MKSYNKFLSFGCSFTEGHHLIDDKVSWGDFVGRKLDIPHQNYGAGGSSNEQIFNIILSTLENSTFNYSKTLIGIQLSEVLRFPLWDSSQHRYWSSTLANFTNDWGDYERWTSDKKMFMFTRKHREALYELYGNEVNHVYSTVKGLVTLSAYLKNKNIDFFVFEGMNSFLDIPHKYPIHDGETEIFIPPHLTPFIETEYKKQLLDSKWFYTERTPMNYNMWNSPLYNKEENDEHPNPAFLDDWTDNLINWLKNTWSKV